MAISGKTFLSAFQVGSRIVPDAIEGSIRRGKLDAEKLALEFENDAKQRERDRKIASDEHTAAVYKDLENIPDISSPDAADEIKASFNKNLFGISQYKPNVDRLVGDLKLLDAYNGFSSKITNDLSLSKITREFVLKKPLEAQALKLPKTPNGNVDYENLTPEQTGAISKWYYEQERFAEARAKAKMPYSTQMALYGMTNDDRAYIEGSLEKLKKEKTVTQYIEARQNFDQIKTLVNRAFSENRELGGATDIAVIFSFMKALDPQSVVREGEFATAQNAGGVIEPIRELNNKIRGGALLSKELRDSFIDAAQDAVDGKKDQAVSTIGTYTKDAKNILGTRVGDVSRFYSNLLGQVESPLVSVDAATRPHISKVVSKSIGPFLNHAKAEVYIEDLVRKGEKLPAAVKIRDASKESGYRLMSIPRAEAVNKKIDEQPSQASMTQSLDDLTAKQKDIEDELKLYKGSLFSTERKDQLNSELVEIKAAIRNLNQSKQP